MCARRKERFAASFKRREMIRLGVIGCGHWGPNHIRNFSDLPGATVKYAVDTDQSRLAAVGKLFPYVRPVSSYTGVLDDPEIDAVVIATPTGLHYSLVKQALIAGKHVLCEKPLCRTSTESEELVSLAQRHKRILMVGHVFLFNAGIIKLKELIDASHLGSMQYLSAVRTNLGPIRNDVNAAYDLASHDISIFNWLLDSEPMVVSATGTAFLKPGVEDVVCLSLRYPGNIMGIIQASWLDPKKVRQITAVGNRQMVTWDDLQPASPVAIYDKGASIASAPTEYGEYLRISMWDGDVRLPKVNMGEPLKVQSQYFLECLMKGSCERSNGSFGAGVVKTLEACAASLSMGGAAVEVRQ